MRVHFRLVDAAEGEHSNAKSDQGQDRVFVLASTKEPGQDFVFEEDAEHCKELVIQFEYRSATLSDWPHSERSGKKRPPGQKEIVSQIAKHILTIDNPDLAVWTSALAKHHTLSNGDKAEYSRLEAHLRRYSSRNTFDYFIHKDLGQFLRVELDFYIKNEVMHLDDVEYETALRVTQYLSKIRIIRKIASKIIDFLSQLEDFQKKLWLKKKFVIETSYRVTLDQVPSELYPEIASCEKQREQWVLLFGIDALDGYSIPLSVDFLARNQFLTVDTSLHPPSLVESILASQMDCATALNGILVHGDNFHALNLIGRGTAEKVRCIYIDPPYNTAVSSIPYKNDYKHSTFATLIRDRVELLRPLLEECGVLFVSIDKHERTTVEFALDAVFGRNNRVEELIWVQNTNDGRSPTYSVNHEYVEVYARNRPVTEADVRIFREPKPGCLEVFELIHEVNLRYPTISEIQKELATLYKQRRLAYRKAIESDGLEWKKEKRNDPWKGVYMYKFAEYRNSRGQYVDEENAKAEAARIWVYRESDWTIMSSERKQSKTVYDPDDPNFRFYQPMHPITGKPCAMPSRGWKGTLRFDPAHPKRNSWESLLSDDRIAYGQNEKKVPQQKRFLHEVETNVAKSVFNDYADGERETSALFGRTGVFLAPKHTNFVRRLLGQVVANDSVVLDCFGGSGSTAHAVILANREENKHLKYILVEVGNYFDTVLLPRVLKAAYSSTWQSGKPTASDGLSHFVKVIRLESYEDALNNLENGRTEKQQALLSAAESHGAAGLREQYILRYMLNIETRGSQSLLNTQAFDDPTRYKLKVRRPGSDESRECNVDLLETFNWLIGLTVKHIAAPQTFGATFERDGENRMRLKGRLKQDPSGLHWFRTVTGHLPDGRRTLVIWRKLTAVPEEDNLVLDEWFTKQGYSSKDSEFDLIYVNGGNNLENLKTPDDLWKVRLIEEDFHRLMFDTESA